jgi:hypothetical protein
MLTATHAFAIHDPVVELLTTYMLESPQAGWPGTDGMRLGDVASCYRVEAVAGHVPSEAELCARHPDLAEPLAAFFHSFDPATG